MPYRYWISNVASTWDRTDNWSTSSGGIGGASIPGSTDFVIFDASGTGDCTIDTPPVIGSFEDTSYTGQFDFGIFHIITGPYKYWVANSTSNWNNPANWDTTSGGSGGSPVPDSSDYSIFDPNGNGSCNIDTDIDIKGLKIDGSYSSSINQLTYDINIGQDGAFFAGGEFDGGTGDITSNGPVLITRTNFKTTSGTFLIRGSFEYEGQLKNPSYVSNENEFLEADTEILSQTHIDDGYINLAQLVSNPDQVAVSVIGGTSQVYGVDYTVSDNKVYWLPPMASVIVPGEIIYIMYETTEVPPGFGSFIPNDGLIVIAPNTDATIVGGGVSFSSLSLHDTSRINIAIKGNVNVEGPLSAEDVNLPQIPIDSTAGSISSYGDSTFINTGEIGEGNDTEIIFRGDSLQRIIIEDNAILPSIIVQKHTNKQLIAYGNSPIVINKNLYVRDGTFNTNGLDVFVGLDRI